MDLVELAADYRSVSKSAADPAKAGWNAWRAARAQTKATKYAGKQRMARREVVTRQHKAKMLTDPQYAARQRGAEWQARQRPAKPAAPPEPGPKDWFPV